jgi:hypothetical protein
MTLANRNIPLTGQQRAGDGNRTRMTSLEGYYHALADHSNLRM